jgi:FkbM family methyltransferase
MRLTNQWLPITLAYLRLRDLKYPYHLELRHMPPIFLKEAEDVRTFWQIFLHRCYNVKESDRRIIDAGANIGLFTLYASRQAKEAMIVGVEPFPETFERLSRLIRDNHLENRVKTLRCALGSSEGVRMMLKAGPAPSARKQVFHVRPGQAGFEIPTTTLSQIVRKVDAEIDLLKMDIEGGEYEVILNTPHDDLRRIRRILLEYHGDVKPYTTEALFEHLSQAGFRFQSRVEDENKVGLVEMERLAAPMVARKAAVA